MDFQLNTTLANFLSWFRLYWFISWPAIVILILSYLITYKRIKWQLSELGILVIPYLIHFCLILTNFKFYGMGGYLIEAKFLSFGIGIINVISIIFHNRFKNKAKFDNWAGVILALVLYIFYPENVSL